MIIISIISSLISWITSEENKFSNWAINHQEYFFIIFLSLLILGIVLIITGLKQNNKAKAIFGVFMTDLFIGLIVWFVYSYILKNRKIKEEIKKQKNKENQNNNIEKEHF